MKKILLALIVVAAFIAAWWFLSGKMPTVTAPTGTEKAGVTEGEIINELDAVDIGDLDAEFENIDKELNQL